jgi:hypothetical protein
MSVSRMACHVIVAAAVFMAGAAFGADRPQTVRTSLSTQANCTDSPRGRTHILRFCGDKHYWVRTGFRGEPTTLGNAASGILAGGGGGGSPSQNWGGLGFQSQ